MLPQTAVVARGLLPTSCNVNQSQGSWCCMDVIVTRYPGLRQTRGTVE